MGVKYRIGIKETKKIERFHRIQIRKNLAAKQAEGAKNAAPTVAPTPAKQEKAD